MFADLLSNSAFWALFIAICICGLYTWATWDKEKWDRDQELARELFRDLEHELKLSPHPKEDSMTRSKKQTRESVTIAKNFRMDPALNNRLAQFCFQRDIPQYSVLHDAIAQYLDRHEGDSS